jgi:P27 family predicted phage terminase small subunit
MLTGHRLQPAVAGFAPYIRIDLTFVFDSPKGDYKMPRTIKTDPNLKPGKPAKPANLSEQASREWDRLTGELEASRIHVSAAHRATLYLAATIAADVAAMWKVIEAEGLYWTNKKTGEPKEHPAAKRMDALRRDYLKALTMLGLRAAVADPEPDTSETLEDVLNG